MRWGLIVGAPAVAALVVAAATIGTPHQQPSPTAQPHATTAPVAAHAVASVTTASREPSATVAHTAERAAPAPTSSQQAVAACLVRNGLPSTVALADAMNPEAHGAGLDGCRANHAYTTPPPPVAQGGSLTVTVNPPTSQASSTASGPLTITAGPQVLTAEPPGQSSAWAQAKQGPGDPWYVKGIQCAEAGLC